jgi:hypothetical protein
LRAEGTGVAIGLPPSSFIPRRYKPRNVGEWTGHLTFASDLTAALEPGIIVELGTHWGEAYFTFCQTVQERGLSSLCYAVDHWQGDEHAGHYGEEVFEEVSRYNDRFYRQFSYLLRRSFDDALAQFADSSIGLLHIDGLHTYDAVKHDFHKWLPKVSAGGIVLLHDVCPRHQDFGVWRLWEEIKSEFPDTFEFHHSWGLGVLRKPGVSAESQLLELLFDSPPALQEEVRRHYVIYASHLEHLLGRTPSLPGPAVKASPEVRVQVFPCVGGAYSEDASQIRLMPSGSWGTLTFDLRDPKVAGPLRIDPGCEPSLIEIGNIFVHSGETGELLWSSTVSEHRELKVGGTAVCFAGDEALLINGGDDPQFFLNIPAEVCGPLKLTLSLRVMSVSAEAIEVVQSRLQASSENMNKMVRNMEDMVKESAEIKAASAQAIENSRKLVMEEQRRVTEIQNSLSWRVTAPVRAFMAALRPDPRKTP